MPQRDYDAATPCEVCGAVAEPGRDLCRGCREKIEAEERAAIQREDNAARIPADDIQPDLWE